MANDFNETPVARCTRVGDDDTIAWLLLCALAAQPDLYAHALLCPPGRTET